VPSDENNGPTILPSVPSTSIVELSAKTDPVTSPSRFRCIVDLKPRLTTPVLLVILNVSSRFILVTPVLENVTVFDIVFAVIDKPSPDVVILRVLVGPDGSSVGLPVTATNL